MEDKSLGDFCGSVLLSENIWNQEQLLNDLNEEWGIKFSLEDTESDDNTIISDIEGCRIVISKFPMPVPNQEAKINAENNFMWQEAVEVTSTHKAHIVVTVLGDNVDLIERGLIFTKIMATCTKQKYAIGVFTSGVVFEPKFYEHFAQMMKEDKLPIFNWIWFGLYETEGRLNCYTYGMDVFGKEEMEVLNADAQSDDLYAFMAGFVYYVLDYDITLKEGETLGFTGEDIHLITRSPGVSLPDDQMTWKISYAPMK